VVTNDPLKDAIDSIKKYSASKGILVDDLPLRLDSAYKVLFEEKGQTMKMEDIYLDKKNRRVRLI
jgi:hypothetical protein